MHIVEFICTKVLRYIHVTSLNFTIELTGYKLKIENLATRRFQYRLFFWQFSETFLKKSFIFRAPQVVGYFIVKWKTLNMCLEPNIYQNKLKDLWTSLFMDKSVFIVWCYQDRDIHWILFGHNLISKNCNKLALVKSLFNQNTGKKRF